MDCPRCKSCNYCKAGKVGSKQRYKCKNCGYLYTVLRRSNMKSEDVKKLALQMYLEGLGLRAIGRILKISYGTVYQWVKKYGQQASL